MSVTKLPDNDVPGWVFWSEEVSNGVYRIEGRHADGRTVSRIDAGINNPLKAVKDDARNLPERRPHA